MARLAKKAHKEASHKPHIHLYYKGTFRCFSHNASGIGSTPEAAFADWKHAQWRFEREAEKRNYFGKLST